MELAAIDVLGAGRVEMRLLASCQTMQLAIQHTRMDATGILKDWLLTMRFTISNRDFVVMTVESAEILRALDQTTLTLAQLHTTTAIDERTLAETTSALREVGVLCVASDGRFGRTDALPGFGGECQSYQDKPSFAG